MIVNHCRLPVTTSQTTKYSGKLASLLYVFLYISILSISIQYYITPNSSNDTDNSKFNTYFYYCSTSTLTEHTIVRSNSYLHFTCCDGYTDLLISLSLFFLSCCCCYVVPNNGDDFVVVGIVVINLILWIIL